MQAPIHFCIKKLSLTDTSTTVYWFFKMEAYYALKIKQQYQIKYENHLNQTVQSCLYSCQKNTGDYFCKVTLFKYSREKHRTKAFS